MTDIQRKVLEIEPSARISFDADNGSFKVFYWVDTPYGLGGEASVRVPLSQSMDSELGAWKSALEAINIRSAAK